MREITISTATSRYQQKWTTRRNTKWSTFVEFLKTPKETHETAEQYLKLSKTQQGNIKDVGGFVGGELKEGIRKKGYVLYRSIITLDIDNITPIQLEQLIEVYKPLEYIIYSTHKHTPQKPRIRLIFLLDSDVDAERYEAIARKVASYYDINVFDHTTFDPSRLMYYPSISKGSTYLYIHNNGEMIDTQKTLKSYENWQDTTQWPTLINEKEIIHHEITKKGDQLKKGGLIGVFNNAYSISEAIKIFLPHIYSPTKNDNRYTLIGASTSSGLVIYENDTLCYSNHSTDIIANTAVNAFDLVRMHLYGTEDNSSAINTPVNKLPSYIKMCDFVKEDATCQRITKKQQIEKIEAQENEIEKYDYLDNLERDRRGNILATRVNIETILRHDTKLNGLGWHDNFSDKIYKNKNLPWEDAQTKIWTDYDDVQLLTYIDRHYKIEAKQKILDVANAIIYEKSKNAVAQYFNSLKEWDETPRLERVFIEYLGAKDNKFTRTITRKALTAAVARIFKPGSKFDYITIIYGAQGIGKSLLLSKLAIKPEWFNDNIGDVSSEKAYDSLQGTLIVELGELSAFKKADAEMIKQFVSKTSDNYRKAYDRRKREFPRQCVFFGTTNSDSFLNDPTGNRRFLILECEKTSKQKNAWDITKEYIDNIWAEALHYYKNGEDIMDLRSIEKDMQLTAETFQKENIYTDIIDNMMHTLIPSTWDIADLYVKQGFYRLQTEHEKRQFWNEQIRKRGVSYELVQREKLSPIEVMTEYLNLSVSYENEYKLKMIREAMIFYALNNEDFEYCRERLYVKIDNISYRRRGYLVYKKVAI